jgi:inorganic pyrophosphatase/exopolyphosphatase
MGSKVTRVIDHHVDSGAYEGQLVQKQCHLVGSACTLIALLMKEDEALFAEDLARSDTPNLSYLLAAAVVLDSYNFKEELRAKKWTEEDVVAHQWLMQFADVGQEYWAALNHAKFDVQAGLALGLHGIFIRDFKQYEFASGTMGVSVSTGTIDSLIGHFGLEAFGAACKEYTLRKNLALFCIMAIQAGDDGSIKKNIFIFECAENPVDQALKNKAAALRALIEGTADMELNNKTELSAD